MSLPITFHVCNPTKFDRHDYVEADPSALGAAGDGTPQSVPDDIPDAELRLYRVRDGKKAEPVDIQIDYPFGRDDLPPPALVRGRRIMTFQAKDTPPGPDDYGRPTATFRLEREGRADRTAAPGLGVEHFYSPGESSPTWDHNRDVQGVKLRNGYYDSNGLEVYFSLVPRPEPSAPINYAGAATSIRHFRLARDWECTDILAPHNWLPTKPFARWAQLTRLDFYPAPWESRWYHVEPFLKEGDEGQRYRLVWSQAGPCRATVTLASKPFTLSYSTDPKHKEPDLTLTCRLYRVITVYPFCEWFSEQLMVRPEQYPGISLAFRAHYQSYVDGANLEPQLARLESIPDYFAAWWRWPMGGYYRNLGYAFASESHVRSLYIKGSELRWRLQLGHEHRTVHWFLYEPHQNFGMDHTVGHDAWYQQIFKRVRVIPLTQYVRQ